MARQLVRRRNHGRFSWLRNAGALVGYAGRQLSRRYGRGQLQLRRSNQYQRGGRRTGRKTKTRQRRRVLGTPGVSGNSSFVRVSLMGRKRRFLSRVQKALATKGNLQRLDKIRFGSSQNQQGVTWISMFPPDELQSMCVQVTDNEYAEGFQLYLQSGQLRAQVVNVENIMCTLWIYDLVARRDQSDGDMNPVEDWEAGVDAQGGNASDYRYPYSTPFQSKRFCQKWHVRKVTRVLVSPGETHVHMLSCSVFNKVSLSRFESFVNSEATGRIMVGGLTTAIMIVSLGGVWNDQTDKSAVGYAPSQLDIAYTKRYKFMGTKEDRVNYAVSSGLASVTTGQLLEEVDASPEPLKVA